MSLSYFINNTLKVLIFSNNFIKNKQNQWKSNRILKKYLNKINEKLKNKMLKYKFMKLVK